MRKFITNDTADAWLKLPTPTHFLFTDQLHRMSPNTIYLGPREFGIFADIEQAIQRQFYDTIFNKMNHFVWRAPSFREVNLK